jgi:hypothetical protein
VTPRLAACLDIRDFDDKGEPVINCAPIAELILDEIDARAGLDRLQDCLPKLEEVFERWRENGAAANFPLLIAAASPRSAVIFHSDGWPDADGCCEPVLARQAVLAAIEGEASPKNTGTISAGLSLLLGPKGRAQQQRDAAKIRRAESVPLCVALLAGSGDDVEVLVTTVAVASRILH